MNDDLSLYTPYNELQRDGSAAIATMEQIRYADQLRLQIRESYLARPTQSPAMWLVDVD